MISFQDIFPDKATERKILSLAIKCPSEGCEWTGELRDKEVKTKTYNNYTRASMQFTFSRNIAKNLAVRLRILFFKALVTCYKPLQKPITEARVLLMPQVHLESCLFKLVSCANENCHVTVKRRYLENHLMIMCP